MNFNGGHHARKSALFRGAPSDLLMGLLVITFGLVFEGYSSRSVCPLGAYIYRDVSISY